MEKTLTCKDCINLYPRINRTTICTLNNWRVDMMTHSCEKLQTEKEKNIVMKNHKISPIYYDSIEEMELQPVSKLIEQLRTDVSNIRGKIQDINRAYGFDDRLDFVEGGLTCMLISMAHTVGEFKKFEDKWGRPKLKE